MTEYSDHLEDLSSNPKYENCPECEGRMGPDGLTGSFVWGYTSKSTKPVRHFFICVACGGTNQFRE